jgi:uroporphyrinogen III methyltransferase/synthase
MPPPPDHSRATVYLVGGGPGDPGLITVRGLRLIERADAIFYDALAPTELLAHAPAGARIVYVGKKRTDHAYTQQQINEMMIAEARAGKLVVRLKGGDPYVFGRGGEEAEAMHDAGVRCVAIPGVTSPLGVAAYAGIPLTHRGYTSAVTFLTGHDVGRVDWTRLGHTETLVIFMGLTVFGEIARHLIAAGRPAATPAAAIRWGTRGRQQTITGTVATLQERIAESRLKPPALIIVGDVVRMHEKLAWFEQLPLFGRTVVVTRAREQASQMCEQLRGLGADVIEFPTIEIRPPGDWGPLDRAIARLDEYGWLLFTSANGVKYFLERLDKGGRDLRSIRGRICAIGPATAAALASVHLRADVMPEKFVAEGLLEALGGHDLAGSKILLPRAAEARDVIPVELTKQGAAIDVVPAYQTAAPENCAELAAQIFAASEKPDWITFTSSSTVRNFAAVCPAERIAGAKVASIGPITSATARELGFPVDAEAAEYTVEGLLAAIMLFESQAAERQPRGADQKPGTSQPPL